MTTLPFYNDFKASANKIVLKKLQEKKENEFPFLLCSQCSKIPLIQVVETEPKKVSIKCDCPSRTLNLKEYLNEHKNCSFSNSFKAQLTLKPQDLKCACEYCIHNYKDSIVYKRHQRTSCDLHGNLPLKYFCFSCKEHICLCCSDDEHKTHNFINLEEYFTETDLDNIKKEIPKAEDHLFKYNKALKEEYLKEMRNQIERIEKAYEENIEINVQIINLAKVLLDNFMSTSQNYYTMTNLINNTHFLTTKCNVSTKVTTSRNTDIIETYFHNQVIIDTNYVDLQHKVNEVKVLREHNGPVYSLLVLKDGRLASCSWDQTIKVFDLSTFHCDLTLEGHYSGVTYISQLESGELISIGGDNSIRLWNINDNSYVNIYTIEQPHEDEIIKVISMSNHRIASCSRDATIKIWNSNPPNNKIKVLTGATREIISILEMNDTLISASDEKIVRFWDLNTYTCNNSHNIHGVPCETPNSLKKINDEKIILGGKDGMITIINVNLYQIEIKVVINSLDEIYSFETLRNGNILFSFGNFGNGSIALLSDNNYEIAYRKEQIHMNYVFDIVKINDRTFATCSGDSLIKIFEY